MTREEAEVCRGMDPFLYAGDVHVIRLLRQALDILEVCDRVGELPQREDEHQARREHRQRQTAVALHALTEALYGKPGQEAETEYVAGARWVVDRIRAVQFRDPCPQLEQLLEWATGQ